mmetsp:Transcript_38946/g.70909  ORF Transcript_38946/g.70909 Transcript_38946/m.70909 type:complete len:288 (-) Transcript_38946:92-955(-)
MVTKDMAEKLPTVGQCQEMVYLREYVTAMDEHRYDGMAEGNLRLDVSHSNLEQKWHDLLFHEEMTVMRVKEKLYFHGGTPCAFQELFLRRGGTDNTIYLADDNKQLKAYGAKSGMEIFIKDTDPHSMSRHGGLEDVSQVEKYVMADEEYDKLKNSVRAIKREREAQAKADAAARAAEDPEGEELGLERAKPFELTEDQVRDAYPLNSRCECDPGARRGVVQYAGPLIGVKGMWVGIKLDEPQGQNNGTKDGKRYFECPEKYGCFSKPENVRVGDYPERDPFASDDEF